MRRAGQERALRARQGLDPVRGAVEARRQIGHFVPPLHPDPRAQVTRGKALHARAQALQPARQAAGHRIGPDRDRHREQRQDEEEAAVDHPGAPLAGHQPAPVRQPQRAGWSASSRHPAALRALGTGKRQRLAHRGEQAAVRAPEREVEPESGGQRPQGSLLLGGPSAGRKPIGDQRSRAFQGLVSLGRKAATMPGGAHQHREHEEDRDEGEIDLEVQPAHQSPSWTRAKT